MKNFTKDLGHASLVFTIVIAGLLLSSPPVSAKEHVLDGTPNQCEVTLAVKGNNNCDQTQCGTEKDCFCAEKNDKVTWNVPGKKKFRLSFNSGSPFKDKCGEKFKKAKQHCRIQEGVVKGQEFTYDVELEGCAEGVDPRIVIK